MAERYNNKRDHTEGFTLVELLVSMTVFIVLFVGAVTTFLGALKNQRFLSELIILNNNAGLVLEQMAREMRTGYFNKGQSLPVGDCASSVTFTSGQELSGLQNPVVTYTLSGNTIVRSVGAITGPMTAQNVLVKKLCFKVIRINDYGRQECYPPRFIVSMEVKSDNLSRENPSKSPSSFVQTVVSSRILPREIQTPDGVDPYQCKEL